MEDHINSFNIWSEKNGIKKHQNLFIKSNGESNLSVFFSNQINGSSKDEHDDETTDSKKRKLFSNVSVDIPFHLLIGYSVQSDHPTSQELKELVLKKDDQFFIKQFETADEEQKDKLASTIEFSPHFILSLWFFIREYKNEESFWRPYFNILPKEHDSVIYWNEDECSLIMNTNLFNERNQILNALEYIFKYIHSMDNSVSMDDVKYAYSIFSSRSFPVQLKDKEHTSTYSFKPIDPTAKPFDHIESCLVPFADIFNHSPNSDVTYVSRCGDEVYALVFEIGNNEEKEFEIFNNYGCKGNQSLIRSYGFMIKNNPYDSFNTQLKLVNERDKNSDEKKFILNKFGLSERNEIFKYRIPKEFVQTMRILSMDKDDIYFYNYNEPDFDKDQIINVKNELSMYTSVISFLKQKLNSLPPTPDFSKEIPSYRHQMATYYISSQKDILSTAIDKLESSQIQFMRENNKCTNLMDYEPNAWDEVVSKWRCDVGKDDTGINVQTLKIPKEYCLSSQNIIEQSDFGKKLTNLSDNIYNVFDETLFIVYIIYSYLNEDQVLHPFIKSLEPFLEKSILRDEQETDKIILVGLGFELEEDILNGLDMYYTEYVNVLQPDYKDILKPEDYTLERFKMAFNLILLCAGDISNSQNDSSMVLLPIRRSIQIASSYDVIYNETEDCIDIISTGKITPDGTNPFVLYHNHSFRGDVDNVIFYQSLNENEFQYVPVETGIPNDSLADKRFEILERYFVPQNHLLHKTKIPYRLIYQGRALALSEEELDREDMNITQKISDENEKKAYAYVCQELSEVKERFLMADLYNPLTLVDKMIKNNIEIIDHNVEILKEIMGQ